MGYDSNDLDDGIFKRCPFCGGEADLRIYKVPFSQLHYIYTECLKCGAMTMPNALTAAEAIKKWNMRSVDVVEMRHGQWIDTGSGQECSICKEIQYGYDSGRYYCPNCGAQMDRGQDE